MDSPKRPSSDKSNNIWKNRRTSFANDLEASSINPSSFSPLRRLSAQCQVKVPTGPGNTMQSINNTSVSTQNISDSRHIIHGTSERKGLSKAPSLYGGGFESILTKVSDTYKIQDIIPKNSSSHYLINQELSITSTAEHLNRNLSEKSNDSSKRNNTVHRKSVIGKNSGLAPTFFEEADGADNAPVNDKESFTKPKIESGGLLKKLSSFDNRSERGDYKLEIGIQVESDEDSVASYGSCRDEEVDNKVDHVLMASFTGELLKRQPTFTGIKVSDASIIPKITEEPKNHAYTPMLVPQNVLSAPQSDLISRRRGSFASALFNTPLAPASIIESKSPQMTRKKIKPTFSTQETKADNDIDLTNDTPGTLDVDYKAPVSMIKNTNKRNSVKKKDSTILNTLEAWKKLREESKGVQQQDESNPTRFVGFEEVAFVVRDLKSLGMDPQVINETDKTTLKSIIGVKKWVASSKEKKMAENSALRKFIKTIDHRLVNEVPKSLNADLVNAVVPILYNFKKEYRSQLGDSHEYIKRLESVIESLNIQSNLKERKSVLKHQENGWNVFLKMFKSPRGRISPASITKPKPAEYEDDDEYLLPTTARVSDDNY